MDPEKLAADIFSLDLSINDSFEKLTLIYWAHQNDLEQNPSNTQLQNKLSYLKSYLANNIITYNQYNISNNVILLSNKPEPKNSQIEILRQIGLGNKEVLKYVNDPVYQKLYNYYNEREKSVNQLFNDFFVYFFNSDKLSKVMLNDWNFFIEKQLGLKQKNADDKIIVENYRNKQLTSHDTSPNMSKNQIPPKIESKLKKEKFIRLFNELIKNLLVKHSNSEIEQLLGIHFEFDEINEKSIDSFKFIKWWGKTTDLIYLIKKLHRREIIAIPDTDDIESIIVSHFYYTKKNKLYDRKYIQDTMTNMLGNKKQDNELIDFILNNL